jgi:hypothetical protein
LPSASPFTTFCTSPDPSQKQKSYKNTGQFSKLSCVFAPQHLCF